MTDTVPTVDDMDDRTQAELIEALDLPGGNWLDTVINFGGVSIYIQVVTPKQAQAWLDEHNLNNRSLRGARVAMYSRDMEAGTWDFNGDPVRFSDSRLLDGQHRLFAVVRSDKPQPFLVIDGLSDRAQDTMDANASRTVADVHKIHKEPDPSQLSSVTRRIILFKRNIPVTGGGGQVTRREHLTFVDENRALITRAVQVARHSTTNARLPVSPAVVGAAYFLCAEKDQVAAEEFFVQQLLNSVGLEDGFPALALQRRFRNEDVAGRRIDAEDAFHFTLQAWNAYRAGRNMDRFSRPKSGQWPPYNKIEIK